MDFKNWQIIKTDKEVKVRPKNEYEFPVGLNSREYFDSEYKRFETFANQHTYVLANPKDLLENVTEVSKEDVDFTWQIFKDDEWINCDEYRAIKSNYTSRSYRYVAYYSPKQEREEENPIPYAPIMQEHKGYMVLAQDETDFQNKCNRISRGDTQGFYTIARWDDYFDMPAAVLKQQQEKPKEEREEKQKTPLFKEGEFVFHNKLGTVEVIEVRADNLDEDVTLVVYTSFYDEVTVWQRDCEPLQQQQEKPKEEEKICGYSCGCNTDSNCPFHKGKTFLQKNQEYFNRQQEELKQKELTNYFHFREIQSKSFQDRNEFIEWLNERYTITKH